MMSNLALVDVTTSAVGITRLGGSGFGLLHMEAISRHGRIYVDMNTYMYVYVYVYIYVCVCVCVYI
jgi:hypothetical protein